MSIVQLPDSSRPRRAGRMRVIEVALALVYCCVFCLAVIAGGAPWSRPFQATPPESLAPEDFGNGTLFFPDAVVVSPNSRVRAYLQAHPELKQAGSTYSGTLVRMKQTD